MLMVCGAALSKTKPYPGFIKYQQPSLWRRLGQTRSKRDMRDNIASKIGEHSFESMHHSRNHLLGLYSRMLKEEESAVEVTANLGLELEELMYLTGSAKASKKLQKIYDEAQKLLEESKDKTEDPDFFKVPAPAADNKQRTLSCPVIIQEEEEEPQKEVPAGKSDPSDPRPSERKQKTLNMGFDAPLEIPGKKENSEKKENTEKKENSGKLTVDDPKPAEKNLFSFSAPLPEKKPLSESVDQKTSSGPSKKENPADNEPSKQKILDKVPPSESMQDSTGDGVKKAEPKNQKTLFDF